MKFEGFSLKKNQKEKNNNKISKTKNLYSCCFKYEVGTNEVLVLEGVEK